MFKMCREGEVGVTEILTNSKCVLAYACLHDVPALWPKTFE